MSQSIARKLLVVGGSGFLGQSVCKAAAQKGWEIVSLSRRGEPDSFSKQGKPTWANQVKWAKGDSLDPASYKDILKDVTNVVHTVGIILESDYKKVVNDPTVFGALCGASKVLGEILGMTNRGNPLDPENQVFPTYEAINRDTAITVAKQVADIPSIESFVYISAADVFPLINPRYITTKRQAEQYLFSRPEFKSIIFRPGFMYNDQRAAAMPIAKALQTANLLTKPIAKDLASLPFGSSFTTHPLHTDTVASAAITSIESKSYGIFDVDGIEKLAHHAT
ncbi:uncharacterized protein BX664DRAFT_333114 [Halteromyces radiatus]|uniref:uncharacterized protein n=1 Tax=Halteromyces radiatus TaxID=101107 RepID=UPI002220E651|nr:uncharacterized protein BX664DRAFT_333114 [Halteromyces radiatus]KAI8089479.1 hypothetical protein BX664DRAFT_333114 [Halteromyces radiatus]